VKRILLLVLVAVVLVGSGIAGGWFLGHRDGYRDGFGDGRVNGRYLQAREGLPPIKDAGHPVSALQGKPGWPTDLDEGDAGALAALLNRAPSPCIQRAMRGRSLAADLIDGECAVSPAQVPLARAALATFPDDPDEVMAVLRIERRMPQATQGRARRGNPDSEVVLVEWGDFQCPYCARAQPLIERVIEEEDIAVVFKHFPLSFHAAAVPAALAVEAAHEQGRFWEMHDALFGLGRDLGERIGKTWSMPPDGPVPFEDLAAQVGLDVERYRADFRGDAARGRVEADLAEARALNIGGTPTFVVGGIQLKGPSPRAFATAIARARLEATGRFSWDRPPTPKGLRESPSDGDLDAP
jgi:predicted DsbA family dithiol-disulfide isomerase